MMTLWLAAAALGGVSAGLLGVYLVGLRMPFLALGMAHAAMAGAVAAHLLGWPMLPLALGFALLGAAGMAWLTSSHTRADLNTVASILLSFTMGLAFLGIGLNKGEMTPLLGLLWGSLLFVRPLDIALLTILLAILGGFLAVFGRRMDAILFSRSVARACGIRDGRLLVLFLICSAAVITLNLQVTGGLMMYSLLTNPAAAAYELGPSMGRVKGLSIAFGLISALGGFGLSYWLNLPTGACIVLVSTALFGVAVLAAHRAAPSQGGAAS